MIRKIKKDISLLFLTYDDIDHIETKELTNHYTTYINAKEPNKVIHNKHCTIFSMETKWSELSIVYTTIEMLKYAFNKGHDFFILLSYDSYPLVNKKKIDHFFKYNTKSCFHLIQRNEHTWKTDQWIVLNRADTEIILTKYKEFSEFIKSNPFTIQGAYDELYFLSLLKYYNPIYSYTDISFIYVEWLKYSIQKHPTIFNCLLDYDKDKIIHSFFIRKTLPTFKLQYNINNTTLLIKIVGTETKDVIIQDNIDVIIITMIPEIPKMLKNKALRIYDCLYKNLNISILEIIDKMSPYWKTILISHENGKITTPKFKPEKISLDLKNSVIKDTSFINPKQFLESKDYYLYSPNKIAFLFLTIGDINQPSVWTDYFHNHWNKINVYVHPKYPELIKTPWLKQNIIQRLVPTEWGFITKAYYELLSEALKNNDNMKFVFISESCIPLKSFDKFYNQLMSDHINTSYIKFMNLNKYNMNVRIKTQPGHNKIKHFVKHYARMCLSRYHSEKLVSSDNFDFFNNMHVGDEFFLSLINPIHNRDYIKDFEITYDNWEDIEDKVEEYNYNIEKLYEKIEKGDHSDITKKKLTDLQKIRDDIRKNPKTYDTITTLDLDNAIKRESFFWRKFTTKKLPWTYEILNISRNNVIKNTNKTNILNFKPLIDCLFIHIPKTAGMSIYDAVLDLHRSFGWWLGDPTKKGNDVKLDKMNNSGGVMLGHISYKEALKQSILDPKFYHTAFKFCFVRNPYDRLVSLYKYHDVKKKLNLEFDEFVRLLYDEYKNKSIPPVGLYNIKSFHKSSKLYHKSISGNQYNPMIDWIPNDIGYIGRVEHFDVDMNIILKILGYSGPEYISPKLNTTKSDDYESYYTNDIIPLVNEMYKEDIQRFGYTIKKISS